MKHNIVVDERVILLEAIANKGVPKSKAGIRLYNQKYYLVRFSDDNNVKLFYLKKVTILLLRNTVEPACA